MLISLFFKYPRITLKGSDHLFFFSRSSPLPLLSSLLLPLFSPHLKVLKSKPLLTSVLCLPLPLPFSFLFPIGILISPTTKLHRSINRPIAFLTRSFRISSRLELKLAGPPATSIHSFPWQIAYATARVWACTYASLFFESVAKEP